MADATLKGRHVAMIFGAGFSVIIAVNLSLAFNAVRTFPGLETKNSYVASQIFDDARTAQEALAWTVTARVLDTSTGPTLSLRIADPTGPVQASILSATFGRATHVGDDQTPVFFWRGDGFEAPLAPLAPGNWNLRLVAQAHDGTRFQQRIPVRVAP